MRDVVDGKRGRLLALALLLPLAGVVSSARAQDAEELGEAPLAASEVAVSPAPTITVGDERASPRAPLVVVCATGAPLPDVGGLRWAGAGDELASGTLEHVEICRRATGDQGSRALREDADELDVSMGRGTRIWVLVLSPLGAPMSAEAAGIYDVVVHVDEDQVVRKRLEEFSPTTAARGVLVVNMEGADIGRFPHGARLVVRVRRTLASAAADDGEEIRRYARLEQPITPYSSFSGAAPIVWFPLALFGSNFSVTERGIPFTVLPVGIAAGFRWHTASDFYLGFSLMANWAIAIQDGPDVTSAPTSDSGGQNVFVATVTGGLLIDIGNFVYVGGAALVDLRAGTPDPVQPLLVFGAAPGLVQILQALQ